MGLFSNKYDVEQSINDAMTKQAMSFGALDRSAYAPMTAANALQSDMAGRGIGMMLGGQDPMMAKQNTIDEIMAKYPDPTTPEELETVANALQASGLNDLAFEVRGVANETRTALVKTEKAARPSKDLLDQVDFGLTSTILSDEFVNSYLAKTQAEYMTKYNSLSDEDKKGQYTPTAYKQKKEAAKRELQNQFKAFRNYVSRQKNVGINEINSLLSNEVLLKQAFKEWASTNTNNEMAKFIDENVFIDTTDKNPAMSSDGTEISGGDTDMDAMVKEMTPDEVRIKMNMYKEMEDKGFFISPTDQKIYDSMKKQYPDLVAQVDTTAFGNPETQQWFETNLA